MMLFCELFLVLIVSSTVKTQVCNETISVFKEVPETYQYTYYEAYESDDCLIWCIKSRQAVNIGTRQIMKLVNETVSICCEGFIRDDSYEGDGLKCVPICNPPCDNGYCRNPNQCSCEQGYAVDPNDILNRCIPLCLEGCSTPECLPTCSRSQPDLYDDDDDDTSETDMCYGTCLNGTCVAPSVCHCDPGYRRVLDDCKPICSSCVPGSCVAPGICLCDPGWREDHGSCLPVCSGCEHGACVGPDQCECDPGYKSDNAKCKPYCSNCANGSCVAPEVCACDPGWYMNEHGVCIAHCDVPCGNGSCVAPNNCACFSGYRAKVLQEEERERYNEARQCMPECNNCDGICVAPNVCKCEDQYEIVYTTIDGTECGCVNCSNGTKQCKRATCKKITNQTNLEEAIKETNVSKVSTATRKCLEIESEGFNNTIKLGAASMNDDKKLCKNIESTGFTYHWIYAAIIIIELLVIICMLVVLERKHLLNRLKTNQFIPRQEKPRCDVAVHYTSSVTCSKIKETKE